MGYVRNLIDSHFTGSHKDAVIATLPELNSKGHGKGLAHAMLELPLTSQEIDQISNQLEAGPVRAGFIEAFGTSCMRKMAHPDARLHNRLEKGLRTYVAA